MNRTMLAVGLLAGAGLWVALLAATSGGPMVSTIPPPTAGGVNADRSRGQIRR